MPDAPKTLPKEKSERILTFDLLRGYFLCVILFNHLFYYPSGLDALTGRSMLYASTAEGFFVVSGIVLGLVRGRKLLHLPFKQSAKLLWKRALQLYVTSIVLTFFFTLIGQLFLGNEGLKYGIFTNWNSWWELIWHTITLSYTYGWADFLRLYALFIFFAPLALWLLRKGYWHLMLAASFTLWAFYPLLPQNPVIAQPFSWQFIFFAGFTIGFYWPVITAKWRSLSASLRKTIGWSIVATFAVTLFATALLVFGYEFGGQLGTQLTALHNIVEQHFNKDRLPIERMLLGAVWFWALFYLFRRFEGKIIQVAGWLLLTFGANSLYVYTISAFVVFFMHLIVAPPGLNNSVLNLVLSLAALSLVYFSTKVRWLMKIIPR